MCIIWLCVTIIDQRANARMCLCVSVCVHDVHDSWYQHQHIYSHTQDGIFGDLHRLFSLFLFRHTFRLGIARILSRRKNLEIVKELRIESKTKTENLHSTIQSIECESSSSFLASSTAIFGCIFPQFLHICFSDNDNWAQVVYGHGHYE